MRHSLFSKRMADGKQWMTRNLDVNTMPSYCYEDGELNCRRHGRSYRAMDQLERLQRQRKGEKVPPPLNIDLGRRT